MPIEFTDDEISIVENMMLTSPHKKIARMIEKPEEDVGKLIEAMCASRDLESYQVRKKIRMFTQKTRKKDPEKEPDIALRIRAKERLEEEKQRINIEAQRKANRTRKLEESKLLTKVVDYSQKHMVKIDSKTWIVVDKGSNEKAAIEKFNENNPKYLEKEGDNKKSKEIKTKLCPRCDAEKEIKHFYKDTRSKDGRNRICTDCVYELDELRKRKKAW